MGTNGGSKTQLCTLLAASNLLNELNIHSFSQNGDPLCIYDNPAYPLRVHLQGPFKGAVVTQNEKLFNQSMSRARVSVKSGVC